MGFCESSKAYRVYIPTQRKVVVSLDVIIDELRGYEGEIPFPNAIDLLIDSQIQIDPLIDQTIEPARANIRTTENEDEIMTEGDDQVNPLAAEEPPIPDAQTDYISPGGAITTVEVDEQRTPTTEGNEDETTGRERMEIDGPAQQIEVPTNQLQQIQTDSEVGLRRSTRMLNPKYIKVKSFKGMSAVVDDETAVDTVTEEAFKELTLDYDINRESFQPTSALLLEPYVPINYNDALTCPESEKWKAAIQDEYDSIMDNKTWQIVPLPKNRKAIKGKWVLDFKPAHKGAAARYKARFVAYGYAQLYGIDYFATYYPVVKQYSICLVLSIAAAKDLEMVQLDIKTAFLYGDLKEEIYMLQPDGYALPGREDEFCKLLKCLYGLKQSSR